jgi:hypothetical protein
MVRRRCFRSRLLANRSTQEVEADEVFGKGRLMQANVPAMVLSATGSAPHLAPLFTP